MGDINERIEKLKRDAAALSAGKIVTGTAANGPPETQEQFLKDVLAFENAPEVLPFDELVRAGLTLPPAEALDDIALTAASWAMIRGLERLLRERSLSRPARILCDLADGAEMVGQVSDARDHAGEFHLTHVTSCAERGQPVSGFLAQAVSDLLPGPCIDVDRLPRFVPRRVSERIATCRRPSIHQRESVTHVLRVRGNRRTVVDGAGRFCRR
jgi:hypothetical protein